jgi:hypothetical protein
VAKLKVLDTEIAVQIRNEEDYICITDIAKYKNAGGSDDVSGVNYFSRSATIKIPGSE